jgi:hypothetical protein
MLSVGVLSIVGMLSIGMLSGIMLGVTIMLCVIMKRVIRLSFMTSYGVLIAIFKLIFSFFMLNKMLGVVMLNAFMQSAMAPYKAIFNENRTAHFIN